MKTITRSPGLGVAVGGVRYIVGGGYEGKTRELDELVSQEAEILSKLFDREVQIRFNSDRESGGAWLVNSLPGFEGNCQVGLCAGLKAKRLAGMSEDDYFRLWHTLPKELYIETVVEPSALLDLSLAKDGNPDSLYCAIYHDTLDQAIDWLKANINRDAILSVEVKL